MSIETTLYSILSPVFGTELYPVRHPDPEGVDTDVAKLYAVFTKVGGRTFSTLEGDDSLRRPRMQISIYGIDFDTVLAKEAAVNAAMDAANVVASQAVDAGEDPLSKTGSLPNTAQGVPVDGYESDTKRFAKHMEFYCWSAG